MEKVTGEGEGEDEAARESWAGETAVNAAGLLLLNGLPPESF